MRQPPKQTAAGLTLTSNGGLLGMLITPCSVCQGFDPDAVPKDQHPAFQSFQAIWDTGATGSVITQDVVDACNLQPTGMKQVHGVHGVQLAEEFLVNIGLPNGVAFSNMTVIKGQLSPNVHALIGMDIITSGDFSITNFQGKTVMSYRIPSLGKVDFVKGQSYSPNPWMSAQFQHGTGKRGKKR